MRSVFAALGFAALLATSGAQAQTIAFASLPPGTLLNSQTQAMAKAIQDNSDLKVRVVTFSGDIQAYDAISTGQAEFFIDAIHVTLEAVRGLGVFEGRPRQNVMVAQRLFPFYTSIMVRKDSPITSIEQLKGKKFSSGFSAHAALISISEALLATGGLGWNDVAGVPTVNVIRGADDLASGKVDAVAIAIGAPKVREVAAAVGGVRFLPLSNTPAALAAVKKHRPNDVIDTIQPTPATVGVESPIPVMVTDQIVVVGKHVKPEVVEKFLKAVQASKAALAAGHPSFNAFDPAKMNRSYQGVEYHPAALEFYKSAGVQRMN
jgi:TRAP transporter TAXI family solute receptor